MVPNWLANLVDKIGTKNDVYFPVCVHINRLFYPIYIHIEKRTPLFGKTQLIGTKIGENGRLT